MDKVKQAAKRPGRDLNIRGTFFVLVCVFLFLAGLLTVATIVIVDNYVSTVAVYYINGSEDIDRINTDESEDIRFAVEMIDEDFNESDADAVLFYTRNSLVAVVLVAFFVASVFAAAQVFYIRKIAAPLRILESAAENIAEKNLDFSIDYNRDDEMGRLCRSFEFMRRQLVENNKEMWNLIDEQKRVQAAFSHDLRTPLTITMGYVDILHEYLPQGKVSEEKLTETIAYIRSNLIRLENFVTTMGNMQKLSDIKINPTERCADDIFRQIDDDGRMICWDKSFAFTSASDRKTLCIDADILEQICINLISNASRFAASVVKADCRIADDLLTVTVTDDGKGFSEEALKYASEPYYSDSKSGLSEHFGLGLHICKILSEKCGGGIRYGNSDSGAFVTVCLRIEEA